jgi:hypothetical protein
MTFNCTSPLMAGVLVGGSWRKMSLPGAGWSPGGQSRRCPCSPTIGPTSALSSSTALQTGIFGTVLSSPTGVELGGGITLCTAAPRNPISVTSSGGADHLTAFINITNTAGLYATGINFPPVVAGTLGGRITAGKIVVSNDGATLTATLTIANGTAQTFRDVWVVAPIGIPR